MDQSEFVAEVRATLAAEFAERKLERACYECGDTDSLIDGMAIIAGHTICLACRAAQRAEDRRDIDIERREAMGDDYGR